MIGIFDSGVGGLTVARAIIKLLPDYDMVYYGDTARTPYGSKSPETVIKYALEDTDFLLKQDARIIVIACNTASSVAFTKVVERFEAPVFEVISPAVEFSVQNSKTFRFGVIGTVATINSDIYKKKIQALNSAAKVYSNPCPLLVPLVEEGWLKKPVTAMIVKKYLHPLKVRQIDTLILGCTHYPLLKNVIQKKIGKKVNITDSSYAVAQKIKIFLNNHPEIDRLMSKKGTTRIFVSDVTKRFANLAKTTLKKNVHLEHVII